MAQPTVEISEMKQPGMNINLYATKKSVSEGMLDIALLTSIASQLKYLIQGPKDISYYVAMLCLCVSIIFQVVVGILLLFNAKYNINKTHQQFRAELMNNLSIIGAFVIAILNIIAATFIDSHNAVVPHNSTVSQFEI